MASAVFSFAFDFACPSLLDYVAAEVDNRCGKVEETNHVVAMEGEGGEAGLELGGLR